MREIEHTPNRGETYYDKHFGEVVRVDEVLTDEHPETGETRGRVELVPTAAYVDGTDVDATIMTLRDFDDGVRDGRFERVRTLNGAAPDGGEE